MLVSLETAKGGRVVVNTDDIVLIHHNGAHVEVVIRNSDWRVFLSYATVDEAEQALEDPAHRVLAPEAP